MLTRPIDQSLIFKKEKIHLGIWFGLIAGMTYSFFLWGLDGFYLARANAILPWAKLAMGVLPTVGVFILAGWICSKFENGLVNALVWLVCGLGISLFASHLPFDGLTQFYKWFNPDLAARVHLPFNSGVSSRVVIVMMICAVISAILGVFFGMLLENAHNSASKAGVLVSILLWMVFFSCMASVMDYIIQQPLRSPVLAINKLVDQKIQNETTPVSKEEARAMHLSALNGVVDLIKEPRNLALTNYDSTLIQTNVAINFNGNWVDCIMIANQASEPPIQQPVFCRKSQ